MENEQRPQGTDFPKYPIIPIALIVLIGGVILYQGITNYWAYQARSRQLEARTNLERIFNAEVAYYKQYRRFGSFSEIGIDLSTATNRYTYRIDNSGKLGTVIPARVGPATPDNYAVPSGFSANSFTATATGNIDGDPTLDQWHVNDLKQGLQQADVDDGNN